MIELVAVYFGLVLARVGGFVAVLPLLGGTQTPRMVKFGLTFALAIFWGVAFWQTMPACEWLTQSGAVPWVCFGIALAREAVLGLLLGFAFGLFLVPARVAGEYLSQEMGLSFGNLVNATGDGSATPLTIIFEMMAAALFLGLDAHHVFLGVLHGTFTTYPVGSAFPQVAIQHVIAGATATHEWGLMLAAPVAVCLFLATVVLALLARAAPQLSMYSVGFPLRLGMGLAATLLLLPHAIATLVSIFGHFGDLVTRLL